MRILGGQYGMVGSFESVITQHQLHNNIEAIIQWFFSFFSYFSSFFLGGGVGWGKLRMLLS